MGWNGLKRGWLDTQLPAATRARFEQVLRDIESGALPSEALEAVHGAVRSSLRLHTRVHWVDLRLHWRTMSLRPLVGRMGPMVFAPVSSLGRRLGGVGNQEPQDPSLWATWQRVVRVAYAPVQRNEE
ncbi:MAG: hypothetical protein CL927_02675 [Deltaproteobacteria bacterium]|nr:hypothetical protein [Deltaproteobacteria bacterium]HCH64024.1 hypothetical protein [Deltaproteobacteria bacterium]